MGYPSRSDPDGAWDNAREFVAFSFCRCHVFLLFSISSAVNKLHDIYYRAEFWDEYKKKVEFELPGIAEEVQNQHPQRVNWSLKPSGTSGTFPDYFLPIWI